MRHVPHAPKGYLTHLAVFAFLIALLVYAAFLYGRRLYFSSHPHPHLQSAPMAPKVDLAVVFRAASNSLLKASIREDAQQAEQQYTKLISTLKDAGLYAVGRRGAKQDQVVVLVWCPPEKLAGLVQRERYSDFLHGLSTTNLASVADTSASENLAPADRLRLIHGFVTSTRQDGGLGIISDLPEWNRVESVMALHDHDFNHQWIRSWTTSRVNEAQLDKIRDQFGESVALYFSFVSAYGKFLLFPSAAGMGFYFFGTPYSAVYSSLLCLWSITFVEWWRIRERILSVRWSTRGSFRVERRRAQYLEGTSSLTRELRTAVSVPVILLCAGILGALLTGLFVFEAFITTLYTGPGHQHIGLVPTILFMAIIPRFLAFYQTAAVRMTQWENHAHHSTHEASLTLKTFSLSAIVAYLGLALSAFVYVPFGADVMRGVQAFLFTHGEHPGAAGVHSAAAAYASAARQGGFNATEAMDKSLWEANAQNAQLKLNPSRLQDQMYAYTVTNQVIGTFLEIGLPFILRGIGSLRSGGGKGAGAKGAGSKKKRVGFEDEAAAAGGDGKEERELLERVRSEVALPEYTLFADYSEMVTQFGYVALWSTIWPLAPVMAFLNNLLELRSDAYKITVHQRRPVPSRTDTIGPWLATLTFLSWAGALTNAALVYLFHPQADRAPLTTALRPEHPLTAEVLGGAQPRTPRQLLLSAAALALLASHGVMAARALVRHALERAMWKNSALVREADAADKGVKENYMRSLGIKLDNAGAAGGAAVGTGAGVAGTFWENDEGLDEIRKVLKDA